MMELALLVAALIVILAFITKPGRPRALAIASVLLALAVEYANGLTGEVRYADQFVVRLPGIATPVLAPALLACVQLLFAIQWIVLEQAVGNRPGRAAMWLGMTSAQAIIIEWFGIAAGIWTWQFAGKVPLAAITIGAASLVACAAAALALTCSTDRATARRTA